MIGLGLRLTVSGGREAWLRLLLTAAAVAIGVGLLLATLAGINAVNAQNARYAWLETGSVAAAAPGTSAADPLWWRLTADTYAGQEIGRVAVAPTGPDSPVPPGIPALPAPGQYYASPALVALMRTTSAAELASRYGTTLVGTIGSAALPSPDSLVVVSGYTIADISQPPGAIKVSRIATTTPSQCDNCVFGVGIDRNGLILVLSVITVGLLFPVLIFVTTATRLSATRREERFAAMRLVGATPRQVSVVAVVESWVAAFVGTALGFGVFALIRPAVAALPFTGEPFYPSDLSLTLVDILAVVVGVPVAAAAASWVALRRVQISPLGVARRTTPTPPGRWRLLPLIAGVLELGYFAVAGPPAGTAHQVLAYLPGFALLMIGLVTAGPWLTLASARVLAKRARRPAALIAGRRLADNPKAGFRAVSGLILALFVGSVATGVITTVVANNGTSSGSATDLSTLVDEFFMGPDAKQPSVTSSLLARLGRVPGVTGTVVAHIDPADDQLYLGPPPAIVSCAQLRTVAGLGRCPDGASTVRVRFDFGGSVTKKHASLADTVWPAASVGLGELAKADVQSVIVGTDGSRSAIERARGLLESALPQMNAPVTITERRAQGLQTTSQYQQLANVVILASLLIAGCSLAASVAGGLTERKRPFSLLRLTGAPLSLLRAVVSYEAVLPLLITAVVSAALGLLAAHLFLTAQLGDSLVAPGVGYYAVLAGGLTMSLAIIAATLPILRRITGPETARNE